jgi:hypothetical protein
MNIEYTVQIWKEDNQYVAHATPLDVTSSGLTPCAPCPYPKGYSNGEFTQFGRDIRTGHLAHQNVIGRDNSRDKKIGLGKPGRQGHIQCPYQVAEVGDCQQ